jgi:hypothetical protein
MGFLLPMIVAYIIGAYALWRIATVLRGTRLSWPFSFFMAGCAAYALSFAFEIVILKAIRYPQMQMLPVGTWTVGGLTCLAIAGRANRSGWLNAAPFWSLGALAFSAYVDVHHFTEQVDLWQGFFLLVSGVAVLYAIPRANLDRVD